MDTIDTAFAIIKGVVEGSTVSVAIKAILLLVLGIVIFLMKKKIQDELNAATQKETERKRVEDQTTLPTQNARIEDQAQDAEAKLRAKLKANRGQP